MRSLLDVNVLIALLDPDHSLHERAQRWWKANSRFGWASCPITENGFVRILSNITNADGGRLSPHILIRDLSDFVLVSDHEFWPDDVSLLDEKIFARSKVISAGAVTDIYLLALATIHIARLVTFDTRIKRDSVIGSKDTNLCII